LVSDVVFKDGKIIGSSFVVFLAAGLYAAAGIGGGGFYASCFIAILQISPHQAVPLAYLTVFGVSCGSFGFLIRSRHPFANRPLIDYLLCLIMEPLTLLGTIFGVWLNLMFPAVILIILLSLVLGFTAWRTLRRAVELYKKESLERNGVESIPIMPVTSLQQEQTGSSSTLQDLLERESRFPFLYFLSLVSIWIVLSVLILLRGGDTLHASIIGVQCASWQYVLLLGTTIAFLVAATSFALVYTLRLHTSKVVMNYQFLPFDLQWSSRNLLLWPLTSIGVGLAAGFVGIAGGVLQGPLLLEMGILPQVTAATTSFMILFTSSSISVQFFAFDILDWRLGLWYFALGLVSAFFGQIILDMILKIYKRQSFVAFLLGTLIIISAIAMITIDIQKLATGTFSMKFGTPCQPAT
jgi:uncharacterized membrane protein YfcA